MNSIILLKGAVKYPITLDPGVWIFDDRKVDFTTYFTSERKEIDELTAYTKSVSEHWDREIREGASFPPIQSSVKKFEKQKILEGTFAMPLKYFIQNAEPNDSAKELVIVTKDSSHRTISLSEALDGILLFSKEGKPLIEDGPVYFYYGNGKNIENPIKDIQEFIIQ
ncbi:peptidyl-prolyl cis-trans isomerase [Bacillus salitolerans]|uniref:Peptidyl-prolyl cis-trans isomerase n=1 Tax=Bacillus salitolerans TaxID=1437434 RepID=A0ABW4LLS6_9BACI